MRTERGGWYGKQGGNGWATGPPFLQKSCKKAVKLIISRLFVVDLIGIEPTTLRMRTVRSPSWAIGPYLVVLYIFAWLICAVCCFGRAGVMLRWLSQLSYRPKSTVPKAEQKNKAIWNYRCGRKLNPLRSQLSYEPKSAIFQSKKLWKTDFWDIRFWGEITENQTSKWEENQRCGM